MLDRAWIEGRDTDPAGTPASTPVVTSVVTSGAADDMSAQVVDLQDWRIRRALVRQRGHVGGLCEYVPRHRAEAVLGH